MADVVKMTDPKLNLVLAEGGGEPGKNRFEDKQMKDNPFLLLQDIELIHGSEPFWRWIIDKTRRGENMCGTHFGSRHKEGHKT